jgi:hypothetical protein
MKKSTDAVRRWRAKQVDLRAVRREEARKRKAKDPHLFNRKASDASLRYKWKNIEQVRRKNAEHARRTRRIDPERYAAVKRKMNANRLALQVKQAGRPRPDSCEICSKTSIRRATSTPVVFDHDHTTGVFRGWICDRCNKVLGLVKDDSVLLLQLADYLAKDGNGEIIGRTKETTSSI